MNIKNVQEVFKYISDTMTLNRDYLIKLDQQNGDGDLGISMSGGYKAVLEYLNDTDETDLGKVFFKASVVFNENAPSSLGTITSIGLMGMAKVFKGKTDVNLDCVSEAFEKGIENICEKAGSKTGEKTILDSLVPAVEALKGQENFKEAFEKASIAAKLGSENTANMRAVHGRAAYYADSSIGVIDGGSVVSKLIFESIFEYVQTQ